MPREQPPWVGSLPRSDDALYAVGAARLYYYEHHAWQEAEAAARLEPARSVLAHVRSLNQQAGGKHQRVTVTETDVVLRGARVAGRWLSRDDDVCLVLVRMPVADGQEAPVRAGARQ